MSSTKTRTIAAILLIAVAMIGGHFIPGLDNSQVEDGIRNGLHTFVFAAFGVIVFQSLKSYGITLAVFATIFVAALIGGLAETIQSTTGRQPDLLDVVRDLAGAALGVAACLLWHWSKGDGRSRLMQIASRSVSVLFGIATAVPALFWVSIIGLGRLASPAILDFDQWWNKYIYRPINAEIIMSVGLTGSARIELLKKGRSGLVISPMMTNWTGYEYLTISASMVKGPDTNVTVRINDSDRKNIWSDQFLASIVIDSTATAIRIPLSDLVEEPGHAPVNLADIQELVIFARDRRRDTVMQIDDIRLE